MSGGRPSLLSAMTLPEMAGIEQHQHLADLARPGQRLLEVVHRDAGIGNGRCVIELGNRRAAENTARRRWRRGRRTRSPRRRPAAPACGRECRHGQQHLAPARLVCRGGIDRDRVVAMMVRLAAGQELAQVVLREPPDAAPAARRCWCCGKPLNALQHRPRRSVPRQDPETIGKAAARERPVAVPV
jgi:hypothetical protein